MKALVMTILLCLCGVSGCASPDNSREDLLQLALRRFHMALLSRDIPTALHYLPREERAPWGATLRCVFERYRFLDYRIEEIRTTERARQARIRARWTGRPLDSLVVRDVEWTEVWSFSLRRWLLDPGKSELAGLPGGCVPGKESVSALSGASGSSSP